MIGAKARGATRASAASVTVAPAARRCLMIRGRCMVCHPNAAWDNQLRHEALCLRSASAPVCKAPGCAKTKRRASWCLPSPRFVCHGSRALSASSWLSRQRERRFRACPRVVSACAQRSDGALRARRVHTPWAGAVRVRSEAATRTSWSHCARMRARSPVPVLPASRPPSCCVRSRWESRCWCTRRRGIKREPRRGPTPKS